MTPRALVDVALRALFFVAAPVVLVRVATLVPITGTLIDIALALVVLFVGERLRKRAESTVFRHVFVSAFAFTDYYRAHPPKPFLYYLFYPLLFPYWLVNRQARGEFWLFKGYNLLSIAVLIATSVYQYFFLFRPELGLRDFVRPFLLGLAVESVAVLALLMPIVTTVFELHRTGQRRLLTALLALGVLSTTIGVARLVIRHQPVVSIATRERVVMRTERAHPLALNAMAAALRAALAAQRRSPEPRTEAGTLEGPVRAAARDALRTFYRPDETAAFELWVSSERNPELVVLFAEGRRERKAIRLGMRSDGSTVGDARKLPREVRALMREVGQF